jgi:hypothetical protein
VSRFALLMVGLAGCATEDAHIYPGLFGQRVVGNDALMSIFKGVGRNFPTPLSGAKSDEVVQGRRRTRWTSVDML